MRLISVVLALVFLNICKCSFYNSSYVYYQEGNIPFILTFPHSGFSFVEGVKNRTTGKIAQDLYTRQLAIDLVEKFGKLSVCCDKNKSKFNRCFTPKPYVLYTKIHRAQIDMNRAESEAYEDQRVKQYYDQYHGLIKQFINSVKKTMQRDVFLVDFHGQVDVPQYILRGTKDLTTVSHLVESFGRDSVEGDHSVYGSMFKNYQVSIFPNPFLNPAIPTPISKKTGQSMNGSIEAPSYNGGFTVQTYSDQAIYPAVSAMQLELGSGWRNNATSLSYFANAFSNSILNFYNFYYYQIKCN